MTSIGIVFPAHALPEDLPEFAARAEALGYDEVWVVEDCFLSGGLTLATAALAVTGRIRVGVGLLPAAVRNPAIAAMEIATVARMYPSRLSVAFGHGVESWMTQIGARPPKRLGALSEVVSAVRMLLAGETVNATGSFVTLDSVALDHPPEMAPQILVGTTGPKGITLAGRRADGLLLPEGCGPRFVAHAKEMLRAAAAPHAPDPKLVVYAWLRIGDDEPARRALGESVVHWVSSGLYLGPMREAGISASPPPGVIPRETADELAVVGSPVQCGEGVERFLEAGADRLVLAAIGSGAAEQYKRFAQQVLPMFRTASRPAP